MDAKTVLVTGATGNQGRAVAEALLSKGHRVIALVRKEDAAGIQELIDRGAETVTGAYEDPASLARAMSGVDAVFAMTTMAAGVDGEVRHGKAIADAAKAAGVSHLVYSSVGDADRQTGVPHFDSKYEIEQYVQSLGVPWTITAPAYFYDNVLFPWNIADLKQGNFRQAMKPGRKLQQIAVRDIGRFNALVIDRGEPFIGKRINISGDEVTGLEMAQALSKAVGRPISYQEQSLDEVRSQFADMAAMYEWFDRDGYTAEIKSLREDYPEIDWLTFDQWAAAQDWTQIVGAAA